jgi:hypothetical protein
MIRIQSQKIKFIKNLFTHGFCNIEEIEKIKVRDKRDYLVILFSLKDIHNVCESKFYKVYKK